MYVVQCHFCDKFSIYFHSRVVQKFLISILNICEYVGIGLMIPDLSNTFKILFEPNHLCLLENYECSVINNRIKQYDFVQIDSL